MDGTRSEERKRTAWMWLADDQLRGLFLDVEEGVLTWVWQAGCHCADEDEIVQSVAAYHREGPPSLMGPVPEDVTAQIRAVAPPVAGR